MVWDTSFLQCWCQGSDLLGHYAAKQDFDFWCFEEMTQRLWMQNQMLLVLQFYYK